MPRLKEIFRPARFDVAHLARVIQRATDVLVTELFADYLTQVLRD